MAPQMKVTFKQPWHQVLQKGSEWMLSPPSSFTLSPVSCCFLATEGWWRETTVFIQLFTAEYGAEQRVIKEGSPNLEQSSDVSCFARLPVSRHMLFYADRGDVAKLLGRERRGRSRLCIAMLWFVASGHQQRGTSNYVLFIDKGDNVSQRENGTLSIMHSSTYPNLIS